MAASVNGLLSKLARLSVSHTGICKSFHAGPGSLFVRATLPLCAEPLKKKKKLDPAIVLARETKKRRRIEKQIKRLEKNSRKLKPIEEITGDRAVNKTAAERKRTLPVLSYDESESRAALHKLWSSYKLKQHAEEQRKIAMMVSTQTEALAELRKESEELFKMAVQMDLSLIPFQRKGPVDTPPLEGYGMIDGEYLETTKVY